jgi:tight adherence protein C
MSLELLIATGTVFVAALFIVGSTAAFLLSYNAPGRQRVRKMSAVGDGALLKSTPSLTRNGAVRLQRFAAFIPKSPKEMSRLENRLAKAGYHGLGPLLFFLLAEIVTPLVFAAVGFLAFHGGSAILVAVVGAMAGYVLPGIVLERRIKARQKVIQNGLPDALDLFIVCLEAGSSLDQAVLKTSQDLDVPYPPLAEELRMITTEMRAGKPRLEAFKNFATRTGVDDVRALVSMLVQADRFGTSIAQALRTQADTSRTKRRQRAEERAQKIGVKMVFPLVFCLFPAFYVVTLGAGVIEIIHFFAQHALK